VNDEAPSSCAGARATRLNRQALACVLSSLKSRAAQLRRQTLVVFFAARDPRMPFHVRAIALLVAAYAVSPIDLIPDFIPVIGYLDDLLLVPLGIALVLRLTPLDVLESARAKALLAADRPVSYAAAATIVTIWLVLLAVAIIWIGSLVRA
jgi:uncharacterized membrane protein YkvA (DUF1232 family)